MKTEWLYVVIKKKDREFVMEKLAEAKITDVSVGQDLGDCTLLMFHDNVKTITRIGMHIIALTHSIPDFEAIVIDKKGRI